METISKTHKEKTENAVIRSIKDIFSTVTAIEHEMSLRYQDYQNWIDENYREMYTSKRKNLSKKNQTRHSLINQLNYEK